MTSEPQRLHGNRVDTDWRAWRPARAPGRQLLAIGSGIVVSLVLVCIAVVASALVVRTVNLTLFNNHGPLQAGSGASGGPQGLVLQRKLVEQRRAAVEAYAAEFSGFRNASARPIGAVGINLDASEVTRRDGVLTGLVLDCIDAVNGYNLAAVGRSPTQLQADGLPERFVWGADCAPGL